MADKKEFQEAPHYHGHRQRLRERFLERGGASLADYEVVELLLFSAKARGDVKPLAKALLREFGSLSALLSAKPEKLTRVQGMGEASIPPSRSCRRRRCAWRVRSRAKGRCSPPGTRC
ncbi:UPF0758 domain-containing protein [Limibacillus halophilus]